MTLDRASAAIALRRLAEGPKVLRGQLGPRLCLGGGAEGT